MIQTFLLQLIKGYKYFISPFLPPTCRFTPSCSEYASEVLVKHGVLRGSWLAIKRVLRCNPWNPGGYDPAP
jgi:hypothetical protein